MQSVTEQVRQEICKWPPEGLEVYRSRYETAAAGLLKSARPGELENLHQILIALLCHRHRQDGGVALDGHLF